MTSDESQKDNRPGMLSKSHSSLTNKHPKVLAITLESSKRQNGLPSTDLPKLSWEQAQPYMPHILTNVYLLEHLHLDGTLLVEGVGYISKTMPLPVSPMYMLAPPRICKLQAAASFTVDYDTFRESTLFGTNYSQNNMCNLIGPVIIESPPPYCKVIVDFSENDCEYVDPDFTKHFGSFMGTLMFGKNNLGNQLATDTMEQSSYTCVNS